MTGLWPLLVVLVPTITRFCRDVVALRCHTARNACIERIVRASSGRVMIIDRTADGAELVIEVLPLAKELSMREAKDLDE